MLYRVEQYTLHKQSILVEADSEEEAAQAVRSGEGVTLWDSDEYLEAAEEYGDNSIRAVYVATDEEKEEYDADV